MKAKFKNQADKLSKARNRIIDRIKAKRIQIKEKINTSKSRRIFDKVTFFLSLATIQYKSYILGACPDNGVYLFNFMLLILLYTWRNITYRMTGDHYYMLEFCYYGNVVMYLMIFMFPESKWMYQAVFAFTTGPIAWALPLVQIKFILHSIDSLTSIFIHYTPMILMWNLHWRTQYSTTRDWALYDAKKDTFSIEFLKDYYKAGICQYLLWSFLYYMIVFVIAAKRIKSRNYATLMTYYSEKGGAETRFFNRFGPQYAGLMYLASHFGVFLVTSTIGLFSYFSFYFHSVFIIAMSSCCFWNGATYYMDYFSKKYESNLSKLDDLKEKIIDEFNEQAEINENTQTETPKSPSKSKKPDSKKKK